MRPGLILALLLIGVGAVQPSPITFVNGTDYPLDLRLAPSSDTTWTHVSAGARGSAWQQLPETLFINRDSISADPLTFVFTSIPARARAASLLVLCGTNLYFMKPERTPLPIQRPEKECFSRAIFHLSPLD